MSIFRLLPLGMSLALTSCIQFKPSVLIEPPRPLPTDFAMQISNSNGETLPWKPLVEVEPNYPTEAASKGTQGWCVVEYTVSATGSTKELRVVDSSPKDVFDASCLLAVAFWKYKPFIENEKPVEKPGMRAPLIFKLCGTKICPQPD